MDGLGRGWSGGSRGLPAVSGNGSDHGPMVKRRAEPNRAVVVFVLGGAFGQQGAVMLKGIRSLFHSSMFPDSPNPQVRERDTRLAACALLIEMAHADDDFTEPERAHLRSAVRRQFGLDSAQAEELLALAEKERAEAVDLWQFTSLIREHYSKGQKMVLVEIMWGLVYADGELATREEQLMRKICNLLDIEPGYLAQIRKRAEDGGAGQDRVD